MLITVRKFWDFRLIFAVEEFRLNLQIATKSESILKKNKKKSESTTPAASSQRQGIFEVALLLCWHSSLIEQITDKFVLKVQISDKLQWRTGGTISVDALLSVCQLGRKCRIGQTRARCSLLTMNWKGDNL